jgi:hypothetical protein
VRDEVSWVNDLPWCVIMASLVGLVLKSPWLGGIILVFTLLVRLIHVPLEIQQLSRTGKGALLSFGPV